MPAPENFVIPTVGSNTQTSGVLKAVASAVGAQSVRFYVGKIYDGESSKKLNKETYKPVEMVSFKNDPYSSYDCMVKDMDMEQRIKTQELYQRFIDQKDSDETQLEEWELLTEGERLQLFVGGINTVEQLAGYDDNQIHRLGIGAVALKARAQQHVAAKKPQGPSTDELIMIAEENKKLRQEAAERDQAFFAMQERLAKLESAKAPKGKITDLNEGL